ncbi:MAG TPA: TetR family transcriptional regulator, partial [Thermoleophilaceae bacterium]|nr:TetR family transcriptional regulator [Thermoleophilaceae bacterium]
MEASVRPQHGERKLESEKAQRIVAAMRESVGTRGAAGATFDHVARQAGVSRGLLHYYFGSKERLLVEVVRRDTELRVAMLEQNLAPAQTLDAVVEALVTQVRSFLAEDPASQAV